MSLHAHTNGCVHQKKIVQTQFHKFFSILKTVFSTKQKIFPIKKKDSFFCFSKTFCTDKVLLGHTQMHDLGTHQEHVKHAEGKAPKNEFRCPLLVDSPKQKAKAMPDFFW